MTVSQPGASAPIRWSLFLLGALALCFSNGVTAHIAAAWIAPVLLLRFVSITPPLAGFALVTGATAIASFVMLRGVIPVPQTDYIITCVISGALGALPYLLHRLAAPRLGQVLGSLVFPTAVVSLLFGLSMAGPFGTWGVDGYVQADFAPLTQLAAIAGVWGVTFAVFWFASAVQGLIPPRETRAYAASVVFGIAFAIALAYGAVRLSSAPAATGSVRVSAVTTPVGLPDKFFDGCDSRDDHACRDAGARARFDALFATSAEAAKSGAGLIVWPEAAAQYDERMEEEFIARAKAFVRRHHVYLVAGAALVPTAVDALMINKAMVFAPSGELAFDYLKAIPVPGELIVAGDGKIKTLETPFGRLGVIICFDADFPALGRQAAAQGVDVLAIPANDWRAITPMHGQMTRFRAIENGFSVVRATSNGLSLAADATGTVLAEVDSFTTPGGTAHADLPIATRTTPYSRFGDVFAIACVALLALLLSGALLPRKRGVA